MNQKRSYFLTLFFLSPLFLFQPLLAQQNFQDGFVVTNRNDTLTGKLSNVHKSSHTYIDFKLPDGNDTIFTPDRIKAYEMGNAKYIVVPVPQPGNKDTAYYFAKVLVDGFASLYQTKIKTDFLSSGEEAFLCKKYNDEQFYPAGQLQNLADFFKDHPFLENELRKHINLYENKTSTRINLFNHYNAWKKHQLDSVASRNQAGRIEKHQLEIFLSPDSSNLSPESRYELEKISRILSKEPGLIIKIEFVKNKKHHRIQKKAMKAVLSYLNEYTGRIQETVIDIPDNQGVIPTKPNGQIFYYYFF